MAGTLATKTIRRAAVAYEDDGSDGVSGGNRYFFATGPGVTQYVQDFSSLPVDDTTGDPTEFVNTIVETGGGGDSTAVLTDLAGGALLITTDNAENDGYKMQLGGAGGGEWVDLSGPWYTYFGIEFAINDVTDTDCLFGVCITDTACIDAVSDGVYFRNVDGGDVLYFVLEQDSAETTTAVHTLVDATYVTCEFLHNGASGYIYAYVDGTLMATVADSDANFPDDELLRLTMEFLTGEAVANTCTIKWVRLIHIR